MTAVKAEDSAAADEPKPACCRYEGGGTAQLHKRLDRLYSQFKPEEAVAVLVKLLHADSNNFEALVKLARAHIGIGDLLPESGANWQERKVKENTTAQDDARKVLQIDTAISDWPGARAQLKSIPELPVQFSDDAQNKQNAAQLLDEIKDR